MSLFLPFSHRPSLTIADPASYTCPVGKYARISGTLSTNVYFSSGESTANVTWTDQQGNAGGVSFEFWVNVGDVVTKQEDNINATFTGVGVPANLVLQDTGHARVLLNGSIVGLQQSAGSGEIVVAGLAVTSISGTSSVNFIVEEYDIS